MISFCELKMTLYVSASVVLKFCHSTVERLVGQDERGHSGAFQR